MKHKEIITSRIVRVQSNDKVQFIYQFKYYGVCVSLSCVKLFKAASTK